MKTVENLVLALISALIIWAKNFFLEVSAQLDVRHRPLLQSCATPWKTNDANLTNW